MPQLRFEYLLFVAAFVTLFWRLPDRLRSGALALASAGFLAALDPVSFGVVVLASLAAWACSQPSRAAYRAGLVIVVAVFAGVKTCASWGGSHGIPELLVPLGFGFYVPKLLHMWIEGDARGAERPALLQVFNYLLFFPTVLIGPIHRFEDFHRGERRRRWDPVMFAGGLERILYGYAKVVVLANFGVMYFLRGYLLEATLPGSGARVFAECTVYGSYLYLSFAGYSDIAIGIGRCLAQDVGENFNWPFLQRNIGDFWKCWHISLSDWCRQYVFTPVMARWRNYTVAVLLTMLTIGLWHAFTARYVLWGAYHGMGLAVHRAFVRYAGPYLPKLEHPVLRACGAVVGVVLTLAFVIAGFAITKNETLAQVASDFRALLGVGSES